MRLGDRWCQLALREAFSGYRGWYTGVDTELARSFVKVEIAQDECTKTGDWRWGHGFLGCSGGNVFLDKPPTLPDAQDNERAELPAEVSPIQGKGRTAFDLVG